MLPCDGARFLELWWNLYEASTEGGAASFRGAEASRLSG